MSHKYLVVFFQIFFRIIAKFLEWFVRRIFKVEIQVGRAQFLALGNIKISTAGTKIVRSCNISD